MLLFAALALSACKSSGGGSAQNPAGPDSNPNNAGSGSGALYTLAVDPDPIKATLTKDTSRAVTQTFNKDGGTLVAYGADGTTYTLTVPAKALAEDVAITMTPLSAVEGMPFGDGPSRGVEFAPDGLQFFETVTLAMALPPNEIWPIDQQVPIAMRGAQNVVSLAPLDPASREAHFKIQHFSSYALLFATKGMTSTLAGVRHRLGGAAEDRIASAVAERLALERQKQLDGKDDANAAQLDADLTELRKQFETEVLNPRLAAAGDSCANGRLALQTLLGYSRQLQSLGRPTPDFDANFQKLLETSASVCMKEEFEICRDNHVISRIIPAWLRVEGQFQLLGIESSPALVEAKQYVSRCLKFDLEFHSDATRVGVSGGVSTTSNSVVDTVVPLLFNFDLTKPALIGSAPLVNTAFSVTGAGADCSYSASRGGSTFNVIEMRFTSDSGNTNSNTSGISDFYLNYFPAPTTESVTVSCPNGTTTISPWPGGWWLVFGKLHFVAPEWSVETGLTATQWEILGGEQFARKEWIRDATTNGIHDIEAGTLKLFHRPN
jgi:hypothetical protein